MGSEIVKGTWQSDSILRYAGPTILVAGCLFVILFGFPSADSAIFPDMFAAVIPYLVVIVGLRVTYLARKPALVISNHGIDLHKIFDTEFLPFSQLKNLSTSDGREFSYSDLDGQIKNFTIMLLKNQTRKKAITEIFKAIDLYKAGCTNIVEEDIDANGDVAKLDELNNLAQQFGGYGISGIPPKQMQKSIKDAHLDPTQKFSGNMVLTLYSDYGQIEQSRSDRPTQSVINDIFDRLDWSEFHQIVLSKNSHNFLEVGGSIRPEHGFSVLYEENGRQHTLKENVTEPDILRRILISYLNSDDYWRRRRWAP